MIIPAIFGALGQGIKGFFGFKAHQAQTINAALAVLGDAISSEAQREQAIATIISAEAQSESWLTRQWRPLTMAIFVGILVSYWFGYVPPNFNGPMPPMMIEIFGLIKLGLGGYIGGRTVEKIAMKIAQSKILKTFIEKKWG